MNGPFGVNRCFGDAKPLPKQMYQSSWWNPGILESGDSHPQTIIILLFAYISLANLWLFVPYTQTALLNLVGFCLCNPRKITLFSRGPKFCLCLVCIWYGALDMPWWWRFCWWIFIVALLLKLAFFQWNPKKRPTLCFQNPSTWQKGVVWTPKTSKPRETFPGSRVEPIPDFCPATRGLGV